MSVTHVDRNTANLTMTITAEFAAPAEQVWGVWSDPRKLERWWGPPTYPATFVEHELSPGGGMTYFMTGPEGDRHAGWWRVLSVDAPNRLEFEDGFADEAGEPNPDTPIMIMRVSLTTHNGGTTMAVETTFPSLEAMEKVIEMGMEEGMTLAMGQIDALLD